MEENWIGYKKYDHSFNFSGPAGLLAYFQFIEEVKASMKLVNQLHSSKKEVKYYNIPASFDIETYSSYYKNRKFANMYIWQIGINGSTIYGRTWDEFKQFLKFIKSDLLLSKTNRLILYVHNLSYEFQFIRKWIEWEKDEERKDVIFSLKERKPIYALSKYGIEFRCSYILSNYALSYIGAKLLLKYPVQKAVGDLDYNIPRNSLTELTPSELSYCIRDVQVVMSYIQEQIEQYGGIANLPLTNTGRVRQFVRDFVNGSYCSDSFERHKISAAYYYLMSKLYITSHKEYEMLKSAFSGGFTHANSMHVNQVLENLGSADLTSSYPAVMVSKYFPMSAAKYVGQPTDEQFRKFLKTKCCLFYVTFYDLEMEFDYESYISSSRCIELSDDAIINNGRVCDASKVSICCTEVDFEIISKVYKARDFKVYSMYIYERGYLPRDLIRAILHLYGNKTSLKDVAERIIEYMVSKNMINASYGMIVTDIIRDEAIYTSSGWESLEASAIEQLTDYNKSFSRFLFYPWGVWVTAHARSNLWQAIFEFEEDYVYADTDSIKAINFDKHLDFFKRYNNNIERDLVKMCLYYQIAYSKVAPKTLKGKTKLIGVWDIEEGYRYFKTLGAKRYMYEHESGEFNITVAGVNKHTAVPYLLSEFCGFDLKLAQLAYSSDPNIESSSKEAMKKLVDQHKSGLSYLPAFNKFNISLEIPPEHCGKMTHSYIDFPQIAPITDLQGNRLMCYEKSCTHLEPAAYKFSIAEAFFDYLLFGRRLECD